MAKAVPLPRVEDLPEVVLFHRSHPADPRLLLQVPTGPDTAETYIIKLNQPPAPVGEYDPRTDHKGWVERLPGSQGLMDKLSYEMHVAYYPRKGGASMILENPDEIPYVRMVMMMAHFEAADGRSLDQQFAQRRHRVERIQPSTLRQSLARPRFGGVAW